VTHCDTLQHTVSHCNTLWHTATHCNTLQHTVTHCNTLQHTIPSINMDLFESDLFGIRLYSPFPRRSMGFSFPREWASHSREDHLLGNRGKHTAHSREDDLLGTRNDHQNTKRHLRWSTCRSLFQMSHLKRDLWWPSRISLSISMTISNLIFSGTGCTMTNLKEIALKMITTAKIPNKFFIGIPLHITHVFAGVPKILHVSKRSPRHSKEFPGKLGKYGDPNIFQVWPPLWAGTQ